MSKINCRGCGDAVESRSMQHCRICNAFMCDDCYDIGSGYCENCQQSMDMYE